MVRSPQLTDWLALGVLATWLGHGLWVSPIVPSGPLLRAGHLGLELWMLGWFLVTATLAARLSGPRPKTRRRSWNASAQSFLRHVYTVLRHVPATLAIAVVATAFPHSFSSPYTLSVPSTWQPAAMLLLVLLFGFVTLRGGPPPRSEPCASFDASALSRLLAVLLLLVGIGGLVGGWFDRGFPIVRAKELWLAGVLPKDLIVVAGGFVTGWVTGRAPRSTRRLAVPVLGALLLFVSVAAALALIAFAAAREPSVRCRFRRSTHWSATARACMVVLALSGAILPALAEATRGMHPGPAIVTQLAVAIGLWGLAWLFDRLVAQPAAHGVLRLLIGPRSTRIPSGWSVMATQRSARRRRQFAGRNGTRAQVARWRDASVL